MIEVKIIIPNIFIDSYLCIRIKYVRKCVLTLYFKQLHMYVIKSSLNFTRANFQIFFMVLFFNPLVKDACVIQLLSPTSFIVYVYKCVYRGLVSSLRIGRHKNQILLDHTLIFCTMHQLHVNGLDNTYTKHQKIYIVIWVHLKIS